MPILTKDFLDSEFPEPDGKFQNPEPVPAEAAEPEADLSRDVVGPMGSAINSEEETIVFYKDLLDMFPDFAPVLKDIIAEEEKHIGQLEVLRNSSSSEMTKNIEKGVEEAEHQLETGSSEEPDDLGEAEVEVADIAIEIPEEDTIETASKGEIPTEGDFKEYSDKVDIDAAKAEIETDDEKSRYIDDILNEDVSKKKWIYQGPIYDDYGMVVRDGYEWVHADDKQAAVKELIKRLKKAYKSSYIHIEPQFVKAEGEELSEGIYSYQTFVTRKPGEKSPTKSLVYRDELVIEHSPYGVDKLGPTWKNHIDKLISWCYENYPGLPRVTADYRLEKFGKEAESGEAYISAIESELKRGRMSIQESLINEAYNPEVKPGDKIRIIDMAGEPHYTGRTGEVEHIDDMGQIHGTWGGCALIPEEDTYELIVDEALQETFEAVKAKEDIIIDGKVYLKKGKEAFVRDFTPNGQQFYFDDKKYNFDVTDDRFEHIIKVDLKEDIQSDLKRTVSKLSSAARNDEKFFQYKLDGTTITASHDKGIDEADIKEITSRVSQRHANLNVESEKISDKSFVIKCTEK